MYQRPSGRRFINISIKWRYPKHSFVNITNPKDRLVGCQCRIIGWTATRVILVTVDTEERVTRVPRNIGAPYS